jgi:phospholipid/cholesterol/gamma-HCH transport system ATP-binding protein
MQSPHILLYDEPTTGLDPITVRLIHELIKKTHDACHATSLVISHDIEVFKYATSVAMLHEGKIVYKGPASTIWECENPYVYQFIRGLAQGPIEQIGFK